MTENAFSSYHDDRTESVRIVDAVKGIVKKRRAIPPSNYDFQSYNPRLKVWLQAKNDDDESSLSS